MSEMSAIARGRAKLRRDYSFSFLVGHKDDDYIRADRIVSTLAKEFDFTVETSPAGVEGYSHRITLVPVRSEEVSP